jgi:hypothetical protein
MLECLMLDMLGCWTAITVNNRVHTSLTSLYANISHTNMSSTSPKKAPLAIDQTAHESTEGWTATAGEPVKFEKLGPMVVNSDGVSE